MNSNSRFARWRHDCAATRMLRGKLVFPIFFLWVSYLSRILITKIIRTFSLSSSCSITMLSSPCKPFDQTMKLWSILSCLHTIISKWVLFHYKLHTGQNKSFILLRYMKRLKKRYKWCAFSAIICSRFDKFDWSKVDVKQSSKIKTAKNL